MDFRPKYTGYYGNVMLTVVVQIVNTNILCKQLTYLLIHPVVHARKSNTQCAHLLTYAIMNKLLTK